MIGLVTEIELKLARDDSCLLVMPMCHANSLYFFGAFAQMGAATHIYSRKSFDPEHAIRALAEDRRELHFAGADALHHDARLGRGDAGAAQSGSRREADDLLRAGAARHQARGHGDVQELRPLRTLRLQRGGLGDDAAPARAVHPSGNGRARMRRLRADPHSRRGRRGGRRRRAGRALFLQSLHVRRLLETAGQDGGGVSRRILHRRRHGAARRRRLHPADRPQEQPHHFRRREHLPLRGRERASARIRKCATSRWSASPT